MNKNKKLANMAMLVALAMIFSYVESLIPINFGIPGMKLGVANLVTVTRGNSLILFVFFRIPVLHSPKSLLFCLEHG